MNKIRTISSEKAEERKNQYKAYLRDDEDIGRWRFRLTDKQREFALKWNGFYLSQIGSDLELDISHLNIVDEYGNRTNMALLSSVIKCALDLMEKVDIEEENNSRGIS